MDFINYKSDRQTVSRDFPELLPAVVFSPHRLSQRRIAILVSFQEPFSALAARSLRSLDFMAFTQLALVFSIPLLILRPTVGATSPPSFSTSKIGPS
jgi:hypothetical protein